MPCWWVSTRRVLIRYCESGFEDRMVHESTSTRPPAHSKRLKITVLILGRIVGLQLLYYSYMQGYFMHPPIFWTTSFIEIVAWKMPLLNSTEFRICSQYLSFKRDVYLAYCQLALACVVQHFFFVRKWWFSTDQSTHCGVSSTTRTVAIPQCFLLEGRLRWDCMFCCFGNIPCFCQP